MQNVESRDLLQSFYPFNSVRLNLRKPHCIMWLRVPFFIHESFIIQFPVVQPSQHIAEPLASHSNFSQDLPHQEPSVSLGESGPSPLPLPLAGPVWRGTRRPGGHGYPRKALTDVEQRDAERYIAEMRSHFKEVGWMLAYLFWQNMDCTRILHLW